MNKNKIAFTVGYRARIRGTERWKELKGREVILSKRSKIDDYPDYEAILLGEDKEPIALDESAYDGKFAWISETELELVDTNIETNLKFADWCDLLEDE